jgi:hypothetical protein
MIIRHTRRLRRIGDELTGRDGQLAVHSPIEPDWSPLGLVDLGGRATVVALLGPHDARSFRFANPDGSPLATCAADFLDASWRGAGPLDWQAETLLTDDDGALAVRAMIEDIHLLIEALARAAASRSDHAVRVITGESSDPRARAMQAALTHLNTAPAGAPPHLPELVTKEIVTRGGQTTNHPDGGSLHFSIYLPLPGFRFVGFSSDKNEAVCTLIGKNSRLASALFDVRMNTAYARPSLVSAGFDAEILAQIRLWRNYLHPALIDGAARSKRIGVVFEHAHISHYIWNELAAVDEVLSLDRSPAVFLFESCNEPIFRVDAVFPEVVGNVHRGIEGPLPLLQAAASGAATFLPFRSYCVSRRLADRIAELARRAEPAFDAKLVDAGRRATIILIGLRLENRHWVRQAEGYVALIRRLGRRRGQKFLVIIDGHNTLAGAKGGYIESYCESLVPVTGALPPIVQREIDLIAELSAQVADVTNVELLPLVPCSMGTSLVASLHADLFATHFGAGLVKYKWIANAHGCVISSQSVLSGKDDLRIYDTEMFREGVTACAYFPADRVVDLDTSSNTLPIPGSREREDFDLDPDEFARFIEAHLPPRRNFISDILRRLIAGALRPTARSTKI